MQVERATRGLPREASGERVSNTWVTYPKVGNNVWKRALIPNMDISSHVEMSKGNPPLEGPASY
jgi:hypothetical protein